MIVINKEELDKRLELMHKKSKALMRVFELEQPEAGTSKEHSHALEEYLEIEREYMLIRRRHKEGRPQR